MCFMVIGAQLRLSSMSAYAFAFFEFKGKIAVYVCTDRNDDTRPVTITNFLTIRNMGLLNTYLAQHCLVRRRPVFVHVPQLSVASQRDEGGGDRRWMR